MKPDIDTFLSRHPNWELVGTELVGNFELKDFATVQQLVTHIMRLAEQQDHHPTVTFGYNTIEVRTVTHDAGNQITEKDIEIAVAITEAVEL